jgi:hypothetical protein
MSVLVTLLVAATLVSESSVPPLQAHTLPVQLLPAPELPPVNFDLMDVRASAPELLVSEVEPHTIFKIRRHVGFAAGYDSGIVHGSVGLYITIAELGRWNFGVPSPEIGFGRYRVYDARRRAADTKTLSTILVSLASVHYRGGYINAIGRNWYVNFEQIFDPRSNLTGSQVGFSFSR